MAKNKFYAVRVGRKTGVFDDGAMAEKQVVKFKGAVFQSFDNPKIAGDYVRCNEIEFQEKFGIKLVANFEKRLSNNSDVAIAYTDGSFETENQTYSYGVVVLGKNKIIKISQRFDHKQNRELRNVAGELMGAMRAIKFAFTNKIKNLILYHDYQGIAAGANGTGKANLDLTKEYRDYVQGLRLDLNIDFVGVKGHSGDYYNEMVDLLAKTATFKEGRKVEENA